MCDPGSLLSTAVGAGTKAMDLIGKQKAAQQQDQANKDHALFQLALMSQHLNRQDYLRMQGEGMWSAALGDMGAASQIGRQSQEEARLASYLNGDSNPVYGAPEAPSLGIKWWEGQPTQGGDRGLASFANAPPPNTTVTPPPTRDGGFSFDPNIAGAKQGGDVFQRDLAYKLNQAARGARGQINALARLSSYGNSYGGLGTMNPLILENSGNAIDFQNNFRRGDLAVYEVEKAIPARQYQYKQSPASALGGMLGAGAKGLGSAAGMGGMF